MWFKKQKMRTYTIASPKWAGYTTDLTMKLVEGMDLPVAQINGWMKLGEAVHNASRVAGEQIRKQAAEIEGLTREVADRREWEAKIKEEFDALNKKSFRDDQYIKALKDAIGDMTRKLIEADADLGMDDDLFDEAVDEIERLTQEVARLEEALAGAKASHQKADGLFHEAFDANKQMKAEVEALRSQLAAAVSRYVLSEGRACTCKPKKGKAK